MATAAAPAAPEPAKAPAAPSLLPRRRAEILYPSYGSLTKLLYGDPGAGKTTLVDQTPDLVFFATEPGHDFVKSPVIRISGWGWDKDPKTGEWLLGPGERYTPPRVDDRGVTWMTFKDAVRELYRERQAGTLPFKAVGVDIVDNLYAMCLETVCRAKGLEYPPETDFGKTWKEIRTEWEIWNRRLLDVVAVTYVTHTTVDRVEVVSASGIRKEIERRVPTFKGNKAAQFLDGVLNVMGFVHFGPGGERQVIFRGEPNLATKDRTGVFEKLGALPLKYEEIAVAYRKQAKAMGVGLIEKEGGE